MTGSLWAIAESHLPRSRGDRWIGASGVPASTADGELAVLQIRGSLVHSASLYDVGPSVLLSDITAELRSLASDARFSRVLVVFDSPGGTVAGTNEAARAMRDLARVKPVAVFAPSMLCSGAYWIASQASRIVADPTALVGSIGVYSVSVDSSELVRSMGVRVYVTRAGEFKGVATPGTEITPEHLADAQRIVDEIAGLFVLNVASGRKVKLSVAEGWADGRVHLGMSAKAMKLVDACGSLDECREALLATPAPSRDEMLVRAYASAEDATLPKDAASTIAAWNKLLGNTSGPGYWMDRSGMSVPHDHTKERLAELRRDLPEFFKLASNACLLNGGAPLFEGTK